MDRREFLKKSLEGIIVGIPLISSCGKNPVVEPYTSGKLSFKTEKDIYTWKYAGPDKVIAIQGTIENISTNIVFSKVGHVYGGPEQNPLAITKYSSGSIEKYNEVDNLWYEVEILNISMDFLMFVSIYPSKIYLLNSYLLIGDREEKGRYKLRIDYYDNGNPDSNTQPYCSYSNTFEIK